MTTEEALDERRGFERFQQLLRWSGLPPNTGNTHILMTFLPGPDSRDAYTAALAYKVDSTRQHPFLTFVGEPGRGKTHLAIALGWDFIGAGVVIKYSQVEVLLDQMRGEFDNPPKTEHGDALITAFERCRVAELLILDDLGAEKSTEWAVAKLDELVDYRYINEKLTIFTTNKSPKDLPPRIRSRLGEGVVVTVGGPDYRAIKAKIRKEKANASKS